MVSRPPVWGFTETVSRPPDRGFTETRVHGIPTILGTSSPRCHRVLASTGPGGLPFPGRSSSVEAGTPALAEYISIYLISQGLLDRGRVPPDVSFTARSRSSDGRVSSTVPGLELFRLRRAGRAGL